MPLFRPGTSTKDIYKTTEGSHFPDEEVECSIDNFSERYFTDGCLGRGVDIGTGHSHLPLSEFRFADQYKEICASTMPNNTVFRHGDKLDRYDCNSSTREKRSDSKAMSRFLRKSSVSIRELTQLIGRLASTAIAVLPAPLQYRAMQHQQILELSVAGYYTPEIKSSGEVKTELQLRVQNHHLNNGRSVISYHLQLLIVSDASLEGWGAFCQGHKTGGQ